MIIYIANEITVRELSSHLLLSIIAASRGHQVMIGSINDILLNNRLSLLPLGPLLIKNLNVPAMSRVIYDKLLKSGFELYCHEQEPGILRSDYNKHIESCNIYSEQFMPFKGVFCWGKMDYIFYKKLFSRQQEVFKLTGSPRVDLWRPEIAQLWQPDYIKAMKPYVLFVSNNSFAVGKQHWSEAIVIGRAYATLESTELENDFYLSIQKDILMVQSATFSLIKLAKKHPDINFIIRPHPADNEGYWRAAIGEHVNIHVIYRDTLTPWIAGAKAVIHNSCTSAIEAAIQGVPVISYVPSELCNMLDIPNKLGTRVSNHQELTTAIEYALTLTDARCMTSESHTLLDPLLSINKEMASQKIIELMEQATEIKSTNRISKTNFQKINLALRAKVVFDKARGIYSYGAANQFDKNDVQRQINKISGILGLPVPKVKFVSNTTILIG